MRLYIRITKYKSSASSIFVPSIFVIHLVNGAQLLNDTWVAGAAMIVISPFTIM